MTYEPLRVAIVGCGNISGGYARSFATRPDKIRLIGATDVDSARVEAFCAQFGGQAYADLGALLADDEVELVVNLTSHTAPSPTPAPVVVNGRVYDAYIPAATKEHQTYKYSCEFDAAWVILQTYGFDVDVDQLIALVGVDESVEPFIEQTRDGFVIHGGDITTSFSGNYRENFLARSSGDAMRKAFEHFGLATAPAHDRASVEAALRSGALIWLKTTVDFKPWRPATWLMPDGRIRHTVLGNDHAVVAIGFNAESVVIRDVLGPTSSNWERPYEYEVEWPTFLAAWGAQEFDGLAVSPP